MMISRYQRREKNKVRLKHYTTKQKLHLLIDCELSAIKNDPVIALPMEACGQESGEDWLPLRLSYSRVAAQHKLMEGESKAK